MKKTLYVAVLAMALAAWVAPAFAGSVDPNLEAVMDQMGENEYVSALVYHWEQVDLSALRAQFQQENLTRHERHFIVVSALRDNVTDTQGELLSFIKELALQGQVESYSTYRHYNIVRISATPSAIEAIAERGDVDTVYFNYEIELVEPVAESSEPANAPSVAGSNPEPGIVAVRAPEVWSMGYTGEGILVANMDTGVDGNHESLNVRWAGNLPQYAGHPEWAWYDPYTNNNDFPFDSGSHGTHTMGTVCGGAPGDSIGVAPGANWIASAPIDRESIARTVADALLSFDWMLDPDGNPGTSWDVPHVCSNSWGVTTGHGYPPCDETFWSAIDANELAGTIILFSAGNEGSSGLRRPGDRATNEYTICAVAATDPTSPYTIAGFSSRGPTNCTPDGSSAIKPDIAAPGVDTRSAVPGGYGSKSGTSMASPHVNGVVALMLQACPDLTSEEIKEIIYTTAVDLGSAGKDNDYGYGLVDAYESVNMALDMCGPSPPRVRDAAYDVPVNTAFQITLQATDHDGGPNPIAYMINELPSNGTLMDMGNSHMIVLGDLPYTLVGNENAVEYVPNNDYYGNDSFVFSATDGGTPPEGGVSDPGTIAMLVLYGPPEITTDALPDGYVNYAYGPVMLQADQGQPDLTWSLITDLYLEIDLGINDFTNIGVAQNWNDDDNNWQYNLPFTFPFYSNTYDTIWIHDNGYIKFEPSTGSDWSNSDSEFLADRRICPLWDDLEGDVPGANIYILEGPDWVTIRWAAAEYYTDTPVHFSCTLHADGTIRFAYGNTYDNLSPTIGVSDGDDEHFLYSIHNGLSDLTNANSVDIYLPPFLPNGLILEPNGMLHGTPTEGNMYEHHFKIADSLGRSDTKLLSLTINLDSPCPLDFDDNGSVGPGDVGIVKNSFGCDVNEPSCSQYDLDNNGAVGPGDVGVIKNAFGPCG